MKDGLSFVTEAVVDVQFPRISQDEELLVGLNLIIRRTWCKGVDVYSSFVGIAASSWIPTHVQVTISPIEPRAKIHETRVVVRLAQLGIQDGQDVRVALCQKKTRSSGFVIQSQGVLAVG